MCLHLLMELQFKAQSEGAGWKAHAPRMDTELVVCLYSCVASCLACGHRSPLLLFRAQSNVLELSSSEWRASFLMPLYFQQHDTEACDAIKASDLLWGALFVQAPLSLVSEC